MRQGRVLHSDLSISQLLVTDRLRSSAALKNTVMAENLSANIASIRNKRYLCIVFSGEP